jgi:hypothetical protein
MKKEEDHNETGPAAKSPVGKGGWWNKIRLFLDEDWHKYANK